MHSVGGVRLKPRSNVNVSVVASRADVQVDFVELALHSKACQVHRW